MADNSFPAVVGLGLLGVAALGLINSNKAEGETSSSNLGFSSYDFPAYDSSGSQSGVSGAVSGGVSGTVTNPAVNPGLVQGYVPQQSYQVTTPQQNYAAQNAAGYDAAAFAFAPTMKQATLDPAGEVTQQASSKPFLSTAPDGVIQGKGVTDVVFGSVREAEIYSAVKPVTDAVSTGAVVAGSVVLPAAGVLVVDALASHLTGGASVGSEAGKSNLAANVSSVVAAVESVSPVVDTALKVATTAAAVVNPVGAVVSTVASSVVESVVEAVTKPSSGGSSSSSSGSGSSTSKKESSMPSGYSSGSSSSSSASSVTRSLSNIVDNRSSSSSSSSSSGSNPISSFVSSIGSWFGGLFK